MNKFINQATQRIEESLSGKKSFYTITDLKDSDLPDRVIQLIINELTRLMREDIEEPLTEWADLKSDRVREAWEHYLKTVEDHVRLPAYKKKSLLHTIINRTYPLIVWPRTRIVKFLFGNKEEQDLNTLEQRAEQLPVNQQLGRAVVRYMYKKELDRLSRDKAKEVIRKVDHKLTERFSTDDWRESIRPLFELAAGPVPTDLLASYFYHRGQTSWSERLAEEETRMTERQLKAWFEDRYSKQMQRDSLTDSEKEKEEVRETAGNLNTTFESDSGEGEKQDKDASVSTETSPGKTEDSTASGITESDTEVAENRGERDQEEEPIWRRFLSHEEAENNQSKESKREDTDEFSIEDERDDHPINELFKEDRPEEEESRVKSLRSYLEEHKDYYIREIFRGSAADYNQALRKLAEFEDWREAYPYIDREIFDRNEIDLYSQAAIHFTDMMQNYFSNY